jgi:PAS domain S-box-containing protein
MTNDTTTPSEAPDFAALFASVPDRYLVLRPDLTIVAVSDAYLRATMTIREAIVGRPLFAVFPDNPAEPDADGVANLRASLQRVMTSRQPDAMPVQRYPIRLPTSDEFEERYWSPLNTPVLGPAGEIAYILHRVEDVTDAVRLKQGEVAQDRTLSEDTTQSDRYRRLLDAAPDAIVVMGEDRLIQLVNLQAERLFGYAREEMLGQPLELLIPERFGRTHQAHVGRYLANPSARTMAAAGELFGRRKDGSEIPIEVSLSPQRHGDRTTVSAAIRDISERKRLEATSRLMSERLASAVESIQDAFALYDASDRLILCNSVFRRMIHEPQDGPLVGRLYQDVLDAWLCEIDFPDEAARAAFREERLARRRTDPTSTFEIRTKDGRRLRVIDRRTPEGGMVKSIWDLTDDEQRAEELRVARASAEAASAAKSEFLSSMSHELRTPLNGILGFAQLMLLDRRDPLSPKQKDRADQIFRGGEHLLRLIDDILDLSRIEAGRVTISIEPVDVREVLAEVRRTLEPTAARFKVRVDIAPVPFDLPSIVADRTRFAQILMNFGSNGIKYNRPDGSVRFTVAVVGKRVRLTVSDTGMGIPVDKQDRLFQPFQRAGQETGPIEGTGIGLVITKRLAELMHGAVGFRSTPGEGSEFWVEVPITTATASLPGGITVPAADVSPGAEGQQRLVLYVEDNPANVTFMRDLMGFFENIELVTTPTAELGIEAARARPPEIIIMDINLPGMSGLDALRVLQTFPETRSIPVIALTAAASERDRKHGIEAGFYRYLTKPIRVEELIDVVKTLLANRRALAEPAQ